MFNKKNLGFFAFLLLVSYNSYSKNEENVHRYEVVLGSSRIIYSPMAKGSLISVSNPQDVPILTQSRFLNENQEKDNSFIVTPPIFRLNGKQSAQLTILPIEDFLSNDREILKWLCVKAIPPVSKKNLMADKSTTMDVNLSLDNCIKFIIRPKELSTPSDAVSEKINWKIQNGELHGVNNSPYYISIASLKISEEKVERLDYIPPFGDKVFITKSPPHKNEKIYWETIGDLGEKSKTYHGKID